MAFQEIGIGDCFVQAKAIKYSQ